MIEHICHAYGCRTPIPPRLFMCAPHWRKLPNELKDAIWANYVPGQERRKDPTEEYLNVAHRAVRWLAVKEGKLPAVAGQGTLL